MHEPSTANTLSSFQRQHWQGHWSLKKRWMDGSTPSFSRQTKIRKQNSHSTQDHKKKNVTHRTGCSITCSKLSGYTYVTASHVYQPYKYTCNYSVSSVKPWYLPWKKTAIKLSLGKKLEAFHFGPWSLITQLHPTRHTNHRVIERVGLEQTLKIILSHVPVKGKDTSHQSRLLKALHSLPLNTASAGVSTTSLGNLFQQLTTLTIKNFFSQPEFPLFRFLPITPCPIPTGPDEQSLSSSPVAPPDTGSCCESPHTLLLSRLNSPNFLSLSSYKRHFSPLINFVASSGLTSAEVSELN